MSDYANLQINLKMIRISYYLTKAWQLFQSQQRQMMKFDIRHSSLLPGKLHCSLDQRGGSVSVSRVYTSCDIIC